MRNFLAVVLLITTYIASASPCDDVDRTLTNERKVVLSTEIAKQLHVSNVDVLQSFRSGVWSIIYIDTHEADSAFLFFSSSPLTSRYITLWSGAPSIDEGQKIKEWTLNNAHGIPSRLAECFAWHVANNRNVEIKGN